MSIASIYGKTKKEEKMMKIEEKVKVRLMKSARGNPVPNQFIITTHKGVYFQSYETVIVYIPFSRSEKIQLDPMWDYSATTAKYRNMFLGSTKKEIEKKIDCGEYILHNLNDN